MSSVKGGGTEAGIEARREGSVMKRLRQLRHDDRGQDLIEYALLAAMIAAGALAWVVEYAH
jgi:hypothetical protein